jgi:hypothetical protein
VSLQHSATIRILGDEPGMREPVLKVNGHRAIDRNAGRIVRRFWACSFGRLRTRWASAASSDVVLFHDDFGTRSALMGRRVLASCEHAT